MKTKLFKPANGGPGCWTLRAVFECYRWAGLLDFTGSVLLLPVGRVGADSGSKNDLIIFIHRVLLHSTCQLMRNLTFFCRKQFDERLICLQ